MNHQNNLIFDSFLLNERRESYHIPSGSDDHHPFSEFHNSFNGQNFDDTCNGTSQHGSAEAQPWLDDDSLQGFSSLIDNCFRTSFEPEFDNSLKEFKVRYIPRSQFSPAKQLEPILDKAAVSLQPESRSEPQKASSPDLSCSKAKSGDAKPRIYDYIIDVIENGVRTPTVRAGRPKQEFDTSRPTLLKFYKKYVSELQELIENNYSAKRSDTFRNTIFSYLKKLPIRLREISCSVSEPKSKKLEIFLDAFLVPFVTCFLPFFDFNKVIIPKIDLFLYFICI